MKKLAVVMVIAVSGVMLANVNWASEGEREHEHEYQHEQDRARQLSEAGTILPLEQILALARERHPGRVLETELEHKDSGYYYEIELLDAAGQVRELKYDAVTGALLTDKQDD